MFTLPRPVLMFNFSRPAFLVPAAFIALFLSFVFPVLMLLAGGAVVWTVATALMDVSGFSTHQIMFARAAWLAYCLVVI